MIREYLQTLFEQKALEIVEGSIDDPAYADLLYKLDVNHEKVTNFPHGSVEKNSDRRRKHLKKINSKTVMYYAMDGNKAIGMIGGAILKRDPTSGWIIDVYVEPEYRGTGIAGKLIKRATEWNWKNGAKQISLYVAGGNERVLQFYRKNGFEVAAYTMRHKKSKWSKIGRFVGIFIR